MIKKFIITLLTIVCISIFCSCNTMHGVGKDIESAGESIQKAAD
jgi:predicted small secreted protein